MDGQIAVSAAVEGPTDEAVLRKILGHVGLTAATIHVTGGKSKLVQQLRGYNAAAQFSPWVVVLDLDTDFDCAPPLIRHHLPAPSTNMTFRAAVRAIEAWLLADAEGISSYLRTSVRKIPQNPEELANPKKALVDLAAQSRREAIRQDMVPRKGSGRVVGPGYTARIVEFASRHWDIPAAEGRSPSLERCVRRLQELREGSR